MSHPAGRASAAARAVAGMVALGIAPACAWVPAPGGAPVAASIPSLEQRLERTGPEADALVALAVAYRDAERREDARVLLEQAAELDPAHAGARFYLGLVHEELGDVAGARRWYMEYLETGRSRRLAARVRARILALEREALLAQVRDAVAREAELGRSDPHPASVAVYPFLYVGEDPALKPLERALAEMMTTDLAISPRLTVLERLRVQLLLDEIRLAESGRVDPATAAQGGRLLRAETIVQGRLDGTAAELAVQAAVVGVADPGDARSLVERDVVRRLFDMQKRLALGVFRSLGVDLTEEERARFAVHPTQNLEALLLFGRGLERFDAGDFADANGLFRQAASLDAGFHAAHDYAARAAALASAARQNAAQLARSGLGELALRGEPAQMLDAVEALLPPGTVRSPAPDALGTEGIGRASMIEIIVRRP